MSALLFMGLGTAQGAAADQNTSSEESQETSVSAAAQNETETSVTSASGGANMALSSGSVSSASYQSYDSSEEYVPDEQYKGVVRPSSDTENTVIENQQSVSDTTEKNERNKNETKKGDEGKKSSISAENPLRLTADRIRYNDLTGDVNAWGRIDMKHMMDRYTTEYVYGNTLTQKYVIPGEVRWDNPTTKSRADRAEYDAAAAVGTFYGVSGWDSGLYYFQGSEGKYYRNDNKIVIKNGYFTTKHAVAKVPDYRLEADSIDIYPGDHYTAHNVKLKFKNTIFMTLANYSASLQNDNAISPWSLIPRPKYDSDNGWGWYNGVEFSLAHRSDLSFYLKNEWYTKSGYKPDVGIRYQSPIGWFTLHYAEKQSVTNDDGGLWIKKRPSLEFVSNRYYLFGSPFYVGANGEVGYWEEDRSRGWSREGAYKGFNIYFSRKPVKIGKFLSFNWRVGFEKNFYEYRSVYRGKKYEPLNTERTNTYYMLGLRGTYRAISAWINYTNRDLEGSSPYRYDTYSTANPVDTGFRLQIAPKDAISITWSINSETGNVDHNYYTYYRDMHSFYGWISYDKIEQKTTFMIMPKDFRF